MRGCSRSWIVYLAACKHSSPLVCSVELGWFQHYLCLILRLNDIYSCYGRIYHFCIVHGVSLQPDSCLWYWVVLLSTLYVFLVHREHCTSVSHRTPWVVAADISSMSTNWWMEDIPRAGDPRGLVHRWTSRRWIQHILKSLPLLKMSVRDSNLNRLTTLLCPTTACEGLLCIAHGNAEVEWSLSENSKLLTSEQSLLCDDSINVIKLTKDAIWVRDQDMSTHATEG